MFECLDSLLSQLLAREEINGQIKKDTAEQSLEFFFPPSTVAYTAATATA